jgi:hypothetical protein
MKDVWADRFDQLWPADPATFPWDELYATVPLAATWTPPQITLNRESRRADVNQLSIGGRSVFVLSKKGAEVFTSLLGSQVELLPARMVDSDNQSSKLADAYLVHSINAVGPAVGTRFLTQGRIAGDVVSLSLLERDYHEKAVFSLLPSSHRYEGIFFADTIARQLREAKLAGLELKRTPLSFGKKPLLPKKRKRPAFVGELPLSYEPTVSPAMTPEIWDSATRQIEVCLENVRLLKGRIVKLKRGDPVTKLELEELECLAGCEFPDDLRQVLMSYAKYFDFCWHFDDTTDLGEYQGFGDGEGLWDFRKLKLQMRSFRPLVAAGLSEYENRLPIWEFSNGDFLAIDMQKGAREGRPVIYLDHERQSSRHGKQIAHSFVDYVLRMAHLGGITLDYLIDSAFYDAKKKVIDCTGQFAAGWRKAIIGELWKP